MFLSFTYVDKKWKKDYCGQKFLSIKLEFSLSNFVFLGSNKVIIVAFWYNQIKGKKKEMQTKCITNIEARRNILLNPLLFYIRWMKEKERNVAL